MSSQAIAARWKPSAERLFVNVVLMCQVDSCRGVAKPPLRERPWPPGRDTLANNRTVAGSANLLSMIVVVVAIVAAFTVWPGTVQSIPVNVDVLASRNDVPPGVPPDAKLRRFNDMFVDANGRVFFNGAGSIIPPGTTTSRGFNGIFSVAPGTRTLTPLVTVDVNAGLPAPGGGSIQAVFDFAANDEQTVVFSTQMDATSPRPRDMFAVNSSGVISQAATGDFVIATGIVAVTATNDVIFTGVVNSPSGVFRGPIGGGDFRTIAEQGLVIADLSVPGLTGGTFVRPLRVKANAAGDLTFFSDVLFDDGTTFEDGVFQDRDGATRFLGYSGGPAPDLPDGTIWRPESISLAPSGDIVVHAEFDTPTDSGLFGVWYGSGPDDLQLVTQGNRPAANGTAFGADGEVFFTLDDAIDSVLLAFDPVTGAVETVFDFFTESSLGGLLNYHPLSVTDDGTVIFFAKLFGDDDPLPPPSVDGFFALETDGNLTALVLEGDVIDGKEVNDENQFPVVNDRTLVLIDEARGGDRILRIVLGDGTPTDFFWSRANDGETNCGGTGWHQTCGDPLTSNFNETPPGPVVIQSTEVPGTPGNEESNVTIDNATVEITEASVTLNTINSTSQLIVGRPLTLESDSLIENLVISDDLTVNGHLSLSGSFNSWVDFGVPGGQGSIQGSGSIFLAPNSKFHMESSSLSVHELHVPLEIGGAAEVRANLELGEGVELSILETTDLTSGRFTLIGGGIAPHGDSTPTGVTNKGLFTALGKAPENVIVATPEIEISVPFLNQGGNVLAGDAKLMITGGLTSTGGDFGTGRTGDFLSFPMIIIGTDDNAPNTTQFLGGVTTFLDHINLVGTNHSVLVENGATLSTQSFHEFSIAELKVTGSWENSGRVEIDEGTMIDVTGDLKSSGSVIYGGGTIRVASSGELVNATEGDVSSFSFNGPTSFDGDFRNEGRLRVSEPLTLVGGSHLTVEGGELSVASKIASDGGDAKVSVNGGTLGGGGEIGVPFTATGEVNLNGGLTLTGGGNFESDTLTDLRLGSFFIHTLHLSKGQYNVDNVNFIRALPEPGSPIADSASLAIDGDGVMFVQSDSFKVDLGPRSLPASNELPDQFDGFRVAGRGLVGFPTLVNEGTAIWEAGTLNVDLISNSGVFVFDGAEKLLIADLVSTNAVVQMADLKLDTNIDILSSGDYFIGGRLFGAGANELNLSETARLLAIEDSNASLEMSFKGEVGSSIELLEDARLFFPADSAQKDSAGIVTPMLSGGVLKNSTIRLNDGSVLILVGEGAIGSLESSDVDVVGTGKMNSITGNGNAFSMLNSTLDLFGVEDASYGALTMEDNLLTGGNSTLTIADDSSVEFSGLVKIRGHSTLNVSDSMVTIHDDMDLRGTMSLQAPELNDESIVRVTGDLDIGSIGKLEVGFRSRLIVDGELEVSAGFSAEALINGEALVGSLDVNLGGTLRGHGTVNGLVIENNGLVGPGNTPGKLIIDGDYIQGDGAILEIEVAGTTLGEQYDVLEVTGDVCLDGLVELIFLDDFVPQADDVFEFFVVGGTLTGDFDDVVFSGLPLTTTFDLEFDPISGKMAFFNAMVPASTSVPEPSTILLMFFGLVGVGFSWQKRR